MRDWSIASNQGGDARWNYTCVHRFCVHRFCQHFRWWPISTAESYCSSELTLPALTWPLSDWFLLFPFYFLSYFSTIRWTPSFNSRHQILRRGWDNTDCYDLNCCFFWTWVLPGIGPDLSPGTGTGTGTGTGIGSDSCYGSAVVISSGQFGFFFSQYRSELFDSARLESTLNSFTPLCSVLFHPILLRSTLFLIPSLLDLAVHARALLDLVDYLLAIVYVGVSVYMYVGSEWDVFYLRHLSIRDLYWPDDRYLENDVICGFSTGWQILLVFVFSSYSFYFIFFVYSLIRWFISFYFWFYFYFYSFIFRIWFIFGFCRCWSMAGQLPYRLAYPNWPSLCPTPPILHYQTFT